MTAALPHFAILGATFMWASSFAAGRMAVATMPASEILMLRFAIGALLLWLTVLLLRRELPIWQIGREAFLDRLPRFRVGNHLRLLGAVADHSCERSGHYVVDALGVILARLAAVARTDLTICADWIGVRVVRRPHTCVRRYGRRVEFDLGRSIVRDEPRDCLFHANPLASDWRKIWQCPGLATHRRCGLHGADNGVLRELAR